MRQNGPQSRPVQRPPWSGLGPATGDVPLGGSRASGSRGYLTCASIVAPSLTWNLPGASMFSVSTLPSLTSIE